MRGVTERQQEKMRKCRKTAIFSNNLSEINGSGYSQSLRSFPALAFHKTHSDQSC